MNRKQRTSWWRVAALATAAGLTLAGCASGSAAESTVSSEFYVNLHEGMVNIESNGRPATGGELIFGASQAEPASLDPSKTIAALATGGLEMLNIYDSLMRYDAAAGEFVPQMAESLDHSSDYMTWTLGLRDNVTFSNGAPVDAAAVIGSQERYVARKGPESALWKKNVAEISTPDDGTVVYHLNSPWPEFPGMLTTGPGMVVSSAADGADGAFTPIGAGPFILGTWSQATEMTLDANEHYWSGRPNLDRLRITYMPDIDTAIETMQVGGIDSTFVNRPNDAKELIDDGTSGYVTMSAGYGAALINVAEGRPGADPRVRMAMQMAVNTPELLERSHQAPGIGDSTLFPSYSRWHTDTSGLAYNPDAARQLLDEAKADGYDGRLEYIKSSSPVEQNSALAFEAMLEAVGFQVDVNLVNSTTDQVRLVAVDKDYDVAGWGLSFREADPYPKMYAMMHSQGPQTYGMHTSDEMDALLDEFQQKASLDDKRDVMDRIQQQINTDVPFLVFNAIPEVVVWNDNVHGVLGNANSMMLFSEAWKD